VTGASRGPGPEMRLLRERAEQALIEAYAQDHFDDAELERRLDLVHDSGTPEELRRLLSDLPGPAGGLPVRATGSTVPVAGGPPGSDPDRTWSLAPADRVRPRQFLVGIFGGASRKGGWTPARHVLATACMGGIELDFRRAALPPGVTTVTVVAIMGGVEILVPPGVGVECGGIGIMGGFDATDQHAVDPEGPVIRIDGLALMGGVDVRVSSPPLEGGGRSGRLGSGRRG
jgi:hypothetical protein